MLLYVAAGQVFGALPQAEAAAEKAGGCRKDVKSFTDFFEAENYASGGDAVSDMKAITAAVAETSPVPPPVHNSLSVPVSAQKSYCSTVRKAPPISSYNSYSSEPPTKRARPSQLPLYSEKSKKIATALAQWKPHPDYEHLLSTKDTTKFDVDSKGHRTDRYQEAALNAAMEGKSILLTGSAGVGKSYVLKRIISQLRAKRKKVIVTASTGCAAVGVQGTTIHSALKLGLGRDSASALCRKIKSRQCMTARRELQEMDVLVVDEISMVSKDLFDKAEAVVRAARCTIPGHPTRCHLCPIFGKAQVILCGDFYQLPPIPEQGQSRNDQFAFKSKVFRRLVASNIYRLGHVHRQDDFKFVGLLNELRLGVCTEATTKVLQHCRIASRKVEEVDDKGEKVCFTKLYPYRNQVKSENEAQLRKLYEQLVIYKSWTTYLPNCNKNYVEGQEKNLRLEQEIELKIGARVLCLKNLDVPNGIANGTPGTIIGFYPSALTAKEFADLEKGHKNVAVRLGGDNPSSSQVMEEMGMKEHKSERFSKRAKVRAIEDDSDDDDVVFVSMSKKEDTDPTSNLASSRSKKRLEDPDEDPQIKGTRLLAQCRRHPVRGNVPLLSEGASVVPVVRFDNGVVRRVFPEPHDIMGAAGELQAKVNQVPLALAYALSVHKSQGMTLQRVQADLGGAFDTGQVYVALSRAATIEGLRLTSFDPRKVRADDSVGEFEEHVQTGGKKLLENRTKKSGSNSLHSTRKW